MLFTHLVLDEETIKAALVNLDDNLFTSDEQPELLVWRASKSLYTRTNKVCTLSSFVAELSSLVVNSGLLVEDFSDFLKYIKDFNTAELNFKIVEPWLKQFVIDRRVLPQMSALNAGVIDPTTAVKEMYAAIQSVVSSSSIQCENFESMADDFFSTTARIPTGCIVLDTMLGGIRLGEVIGILGPMKGGKTSFCHTLAVDYMKNNPQNRVTFVSYEENFKQQAPKLIISWLEINRNTVEGKSLKDLTPELRSQISDVSARMHRQMTFVDMSGSREGQGYGGYVELDSALSKISASGELGNLVIVDHLLPMVTNYLSAQNKDLTKNMRHEISAAVKGMSHIALKFNVSLVLAHQLDAEGNKFNKLPSHMNSAENKLFAQYLHDCLCLSPRNEQNFAHLNLSASRSLANTHKLVLIDGARCRVSLVQQNMSLTSSGNITNQGGIVLNDALAIANSFAK